MSAFVKKNCMEMIGSRRCLHAATLGSESGASIWDRDGKIERAIDEMIGQNPLMTFEKLFERLL